MVYIFMVSFKYRVCVHICGTPSRIATRMTTPLPPSRPSVAELFRFLEDFKSATGVGKLVLMAQLREFVRRVDIYEMLNAIRVIDDEDDLNILIGVGMRGVLYYAVLKRKAEMEGI